MAEGNPYHDPHSGEFSSKSKGRASGHNAGKGNRAAAAHVSLLHRAISGVKRIENYATSGVHKVAGAINYSIKASKMVKDKISKTADKVTSPLSYHGEKAKKGKK